MRRAVAVGAVASVVIAAGLIAGCGQEDQGRTTSQVAAKVNGDEITIHQINHMLARSSVPPESADAARRQMLERLIDQQLAKQQALERKLDRTPAVLQSMEAARDEILARAYREQLVASVPPPSDEEVRKYYAEHPALFAQRRLFGLEEISVTLSDPAAAELKSFAGQGRDLREIAGWLRSRKATFTENRGVRAAEQLPLDWLPHMQGMKDGDTRLFEGAQRLYAVRLAATQPAPIDEAAARPRIRQFLSNRRFSEAVAKDAGHLREKSNIDYLGEFADLAASKRAAVPPDEPAQDASIEKGLRGLR